MAVTFNFEYSNIVLSIGGQILFILFAIMILLFGTPTINFPVANVRKMLSKGVGASAAAAANS
jgi:hypothetical protein